MKNIKRKKRRTLTSLGAAAVLLCFAGANLYVHPEQKQEMPQEKEADTKTETEASGDPVGKETLTETAAEDKSVYDDDEEDSVVTMYLTVRTGNAEDNTDHTWTEINSLDAYYYEDNNLERYNCEALLQIGDENGPVKGEFGYDDEAANATVQIRGQTSSTYSNKNYKIRIKAGKGSWRGERTIALNKHQEDPTRFANKLAYDLMKRIPGMIGARTQFVHLYVKDETEGGSGGYVDYGLYTQVEQMNRTYLKNHGLDNRGQLYKVNMFEWYRYEDVIMLEDDAAYNEKEFESYLEIKGNSDHSKLIEMLDAVNDYTIPITETVEQYFDIENICYWMGFQILIGNYDTGSRNLMLYSPLNGEKWYLISWDNDSAFTRNYYRSKDYTEGASWECGITQFTNCVLFERILKEESYRKILDAAIDDLMQNYVNETTVSHEIDQYQSITEEYLYDGADAKNALIESRVDYENLLKLIPEEIQENYGYYLESLEKPWPFFVGVPEMENGSLHISWDTAYDLDGEDITYSVVLATDYDFENVIDAAENIRIPETDFELPDAGTYYLRVRAKNESGYEQDCFDYIATELNGKVYGAYEFSVDENGNVSIPED